MKKMLLYIAIVLFFFGVLFFSCSKNGDSESEKGAIEKMTEQTGKDIVRTIRTPIEKAHSVKNMEEDRLSDIDETLKDR